MCKRLQPSGSYNWAQLQFMQRGNYKLESPKRARPRSRQHCAHRHRKFGVYATLVLVAAALGYQQCKEKNEEVKKVCRESHQGNLSRVSCRP